MTDNHVHRLPEPLPPNTTIVTVSNDQMVGSNLSNGDVDIDLFDDESRAIRDYNSTMRSLDDDSDTYHCHDGRKPAGIDRRSRRVLLAASAICLLFMLVEVIAGIWANSLAIITDAAHMLTDLASFLISLFALHLAARPPSQRMSFGWHRAEVLGAFFSVFLIWIVTGILVYLAVQRVITRDYAIDAPVMLITAAVGVMVNIVMGFLLHFGGGSHGHSHGATSHHNNRHDDETSYLLEASPTHNHRRQRNINVRAALIHVVGDFVQSIGVFLAAVLIYFQPSWSIADPICTFIFSLLVLLTTFNVMRDALNVLMEGKPSSIDFSAVIASLHDIDGVRRVHDLRIWSLTMDKVALSVHLAIDPTVQNKDAVLKMASDMLRYRFGVVETTVQIELLTDRHSNCAQCPTPP